MKPLRIEESVIIDKHPELVFDFTQDYGKRLRWDTFLKRADLMNGASKAGKGVKAYCVAKNGLGMVTEYVTFNRREVIFLYSFTLRFPFTLLSGYVKRNLTTNVRQRLVDLKYNIEHI